MGRIIAIDYGSKRTGIAVTDTLQLIANGLATVSTAKLLDFLRDYFEKEEIDRVVVGLPRTVRGDLSENEYNIRLFVAKFKKLFPHILIVFHDERFTSVLAHQAMLDGGLRRKQRQNKALVDEISATIILQSYMESVKYKYKQS